MPIKAVKLDDAEAQALWTALSPAADWPTKFQPGIASQIMHRGRTSLTTCHANRKETWARVQIELESWHVLYPGPMDGPGNPKKSRHEIESVVVGWPWPCLSGHRQFSDAPLSEASFGGWHVPLHTIDVLGRRCYVPFVGVPSPQHVFVPYRPLWPELAWDTLLFAAPAWLLLVVPGRIRRLVRLHQGFCPRCGYDLRGASPPGADDKRQRGCPECGWRRESAIDQPPP
jgi:hypothetical protein